MPRRNPKPKPGELVAWYGKLERGDNPDLCVAWGGEGAGKADGGILCHTLCDVKLWDWDTSLLQEFEKRGYDLGTLKFSIQQKVR